MIYLVTFAAAALIIIASALVFVFKDVLHVAVALTTVFLANSLLFLVLGQPILAIIQLFIMVGGVSTYLFVGVASASYSHFKYINYAALASLALLIFAIMAYGAVRSGTVASAGTANATNTYSSNQIASSFSSGYTIASMYAIAAMLFSLSLGAILLLNKLRMI